MAADYTCTLSREVLEKAERELNETPVRREQELIKFRELIKQNGAIRCQIDPPFLLRFLRARKFDSGRALELLVNYLTISGENKKTIGPMVPSAAAYDTGISILLPNRDREGRRVMYFRMGTWNPETHTPWDTMKLDILNLEQAITDEDIQIHGLVGIGDLANIGMTHAMNINRTVSKTMNRMFQSAFPLRIKAIHVVNEPVIFDIIKTIMTPLMSSKLLSRLHLHGGSRESLLKHFDRGALPDELGGTCGPADKLAEDWKTFMLSQEPAFELLAKNHIELPKDVASVSKTDGIVGTGFRKLDVS